MPIWSNVRNLHSVDADTGIADSDKDNVAKDLGIVVIQNSYISQLRHAHFFFFFFFERMFVQYIFTASFVKGLLKENIFIDFRKSSF